MVASPEIFRASEFHFYVRPVLINALKQQKLTAVGQSMVGGADNYQQVFEQNSGLHHLDMTTMIRLGTAIETFLRDKYMQAKGHANLSELRADPNFKQGAFQRVGVGQTGVGAAAALLQTVGIDLGTKPHLQQAREVMLHRHLYAHSGGVLDEKYITDWRILTSENLLTISGLENALEEDMVWFEPLKKLNEYIEALKIFTADS